MRVGGLGVAVIVAALSSPAFAGEGVPAATVREVDDVYFGTRVIDPYRWMEKPGAELDRFLEAENAHTRAMLGKLAGPRAKLLGRIRELQRGTATVRFVARVGERYFFLETPAGAKDAHLALRAVAGGPVTVLLEPSRFAKKGSHASIDFFRPSRDASKVAVAVSHGGGEDWTFHFLDVDGGKLLADEVAGPAEPLPSWSADGRSIYYPRLRKLSKSEPIADKLEGIRVFRHVLGTEEARDEAVFDAAVAPGTDTKAQTFPSLALTDDARYEIGAIGIGTEQSSAFWIRKAGSSAPWRKIAGFADRVTALAERDDVLYAIDQKTSAGRVLSFDARNGSAAEAKVLVDDADFVVSTYGDLGAAGDALYVAGMRGGSAAIRRIAYDGKTPPRDLGLPASGTLIEFTADTNLPGFSFALQAPTLSPRVYRYEPQNGSFADSRLQTPDPADFSNIETREVEVESTDGARVPMTITLRKDLALDGSHPTLLTVYGAYGAVVPKWFSAPNLAWYEQGGILAHVAARGGGEKGAAWHEAAVRTHKQRTIDDVIAAARWLIAKKYTAPAHLAVAGKSAGGLPSAGAVVQHPELFGAALIRVGVVDMLRFEEGALGSANTMEFGSVKNEDEFRVLREVSPYANVEKGIRYPAVMLETGINDPRVPSWQLAKMTARLQAATSSGKPVLLRVDYDAGHGLGSDKDQVAELMADEYTFLGWQLGMKGFITE